MIRRGVVLLLLPLLLVACAATGPTGGGTGGRTGGSTAQDAAGVASRATPLPDTLPAMKSFTPGPPGGGRIHANADIARDFLELSFEMESGKTIQRLTRFDGPVSVAFATRQSRRLTQDLRDMLARVRTEAGIDVSLATPGTQANIVVVTLPRKTLRKAVPKAACFVVPRVRTWKEFLKARRNGSLDWTTLTRRQNATAFIPDDVSPQEARDCLHEEITQALGPLNDIYRLPDSIYNDDNINTVLTRFDMLILKTYYDPALKNGMSRQDVAAALPAILRRINPAGEGAPRDGLETTPRAWIDTLERALAPNTSDARRLLSARRAVAMAEARGWRDNRLGFALFAEGRLALGRDARTAVESFARAYALYSEVYGRDDIHTAHVALQIAAFALSSGRAKTALDLVNRSIPTVARAQNASLLATFLMIKAEALDSLGRRTEAATVRLDSIGWARYGFASSGEIRAHLRETAALRPRNLKPES